MNQEFADRLILACSSFGWGPKDLLPEFYRKGKGLVLGNGLVVTVWYCMSVPDCPLQALKDIEQANMMEHLYRDILGS